MTGFETVLLRVAGTAAGALVKSLLTRTPGAGLTPDPARPAPLRRRPVELGDPEIRRLTQTLASRMGPVCGSLPEHERRAALDAVADAFTTLGPLTADALLAADLDPSTLAATLPPPPPGLNEAAERLYRDLIALCCEHAVEYVTTLPAFGARTDVELVQRTGRIAESLDGIRDRLGPTPRSEAARFEEAYTRYIAAAHDRLHLFGLTLSRTDRQEWPLDLAYISLAVTADRSTAGLPGPRRAHTVRAERALGAAPRALLRGPAGSGKSTVVQYLALNSARRSFGPELAELNTCVPFVLRLRSFHSSNTLPVPEDWLRASGIPLRAPDGWTHDLLASGRALVLIDGVDEMPRRLRKRTGEWLRSLVTAFPDARYVVTTRPSAVPEDWLAGQGFVPHALLPMERADVRAFITHWHASAKEECDEEERDRLDAYATSLAQAVGDRRDLGRLATNPLMCALLCALNRDRRMQLPRARKELYDAALDMLLVRRDIEREIDGVEGVYLSRDEQTALLQRLAYWLIRNGHLEAGYDEAVQMIDTWLDAMPQVREQADAAQVFFHLLIRSGLLIEPAPGTVVFVHRTFQDYLGAKAAVESRDFGVLVGNAHDDSWEDVVRMSVGHARPDERARLLRGLLGRADGSPEQSGRLVLLAATCLEHAPELAPEVREAVTSRTAALLPPQSSAQAQQLAKAGELVLDLLPPPDGLADREAAATVLTAALLGGSRALSVVARFRHRTGYEVCSELSDAWGRFPLTEYAAEVLADATLGDAQLAVGTGERIGALPGLRRIKNVHLQGDYGIPAELTGMKQLEGLTIRANNVSDLSPLAALPALARLTLVYCPRLTTLGPLRELPLESLTLSMMRQDLSLESLGELTALRQLTLDTRIAGDRVSGIPATPDLRALHLLDRSEPLVVDSLERWPGLKDLILQGRHLIDQFLRLPKVPPLSTLDLVHHPALCARDLARFDRLRSLHTIGCAFSGSLEPLASLPRLSFLSLGNGGGPPIDLSPLAALDGLTIEIGEGTDVTGTEALPPERLRVRRP
ncbi:NACHT domain-containing protein [Streptomyces sp. NPDC059355]|uniref:NACHT domain-containing protein n=1 Tax=Streptomyces sp. NPDC059355 TaxID=3346811 RepID=UPI00369D3202